MPASSASPRRPVPNRREVIPIEILSFDNAHVMIVSNVHELDAEALRICKRPGKKGTNGKKARKAFREECKEGVPGV